jgi:hypothetical protein
LLSTIQINENKLYIAIPKSWNSKTKLKIMRNYSTYVFCLVVGFSPFSCEQKSSSDSQTVDNQEITEGEAAAHKSQPAPKTLTDEVDVAEEEIDIIEQIRADYGATMEKLDKRSLKKEIKKFDCDDDPGGGTLTRYYNGEAIEMLEYSIGYEHGWISQKIYFKNEVPYFIFVEEGYWYFGGGEGADDSGENTIDDITETRYYMESGKVIQELSKKYLIKSWEAKPKVNEIPNTKVTEGLGKPYPQAETIPKLLKAEVGC